jgi:hypothetical protein
MIELTKALDGGRMVEVAWNPPEVDVAKPATARVYDYWLGGKDNFAADRAAGDEVARRLPNVFTMARENRRFLGVAVRRLAGLGIRQFLDIGTGIPTSPNTHEIAQAIHPDAHVVYVDHDPIVLAHARAKMRCPAPGRTGYVDADLRDPKAILSSHVTRDLLDFNQPVAVLLIALLHFIPDADNPADIINTLIKALPAGSHIAISHATNEYDPEGIAKATAVYEAAGLTPRIRSGAELEELVEGVGLRPLDPGVAPLRDFTDDEDGFAIRPPAAETSFNAVIAAV